MSDLEFPFDPKETFSAEEIERARELRDLVGPVKTKDRFDSCPHTPPCPTEAICLEEIAWYLRHKTELDA